MLELAVVTVLLMRVSAAVGIGTGLAVSFVKVSQKLLGKLLVVVAALKIFVSKQLAVIFIVG
jgi:hypothetical protein